MDFLKAQLDRIQAQLTALTATQKMLTASLLAIMVITIVLWGRYAGEAEMAPLLDQSFSPAEVGQIQQHLHDRNIRISVAGDKIIVPADQRMSILADLTYRRMMPSNTSSGFDEIIRQISPWDSEEKEGRIWNHGKEAVLSRLIGMYPDVAQANVVIDPTNVSRIEGSVLPSATVFITLQEGKQSSQRLVDAAAAAVAGAQSGLDIDRIKVIVDGLTHKAHDGSSDPLSEAPELLATARAYANAAEESVRKVYGTIPGFFVSVTVKLNLTSVQTDKKEFDAKNTVQKTDNSLDERDEISGPPTSGADTSAQPNTELSVGIAPTRAPPGQTQTHEKLQEHSQIFVPETHTVSKTPSGEPTTVGATVRVPLSHFAILFRSMEPSIKEPTYKQMQPFIEKELSKMRQGVANCVMLDPTKVAIDVYPDSPLNLPAPAVAGSVPSVSMLIGGHTKEMALAGLALMSLFMASMMVRKTTPAVAPATGLDSLGKPLSAGELLAGEIEHSSADGMEMDAETSHAQQVLDQVSTLVRQDPDSAAALVKRWLNRE